MRAMLRDETPLKHSPFPFRQPALFDEKLSQHASNPDSFMEEFSAQLRELVGSCEQAQSGVKARLEELAHSFDGHAERVRGQSHLLE